MHTQVCSKSTANKSNLYKKKMFGPFSETRRYHENLYQSMTTKEH